MGKEFGQRSVRRLLVAAVAAVVGSLLAAVLPPSLSHNTASLFASSPAHALDATGFDPGYIVSDSVFFDGYAMGSAQIQQFLNARVPQCYSDYACLMNYRQAVPTMAADRFCDEVVGGANLTAAQIIERVGQACRVSPKALLVLLEKEQSLVTMSAPSRIRFERATGMACPDTAPCDPAFAGFFYQVYYGARQYQIYAQFPGSFGYRAGQTHDILYHPNRDCGTQRIHVRNQATAGLYIYTPYTPNEAALRNLFGVGDACSSYGNRNFWRIFSTWFGSPISGSSLVKTPTGTKVYFISGSERYLIPDSTTLHLYTTSFGPVGEVSAPYLRAIPVVGRASAVVRDHSGSMGLLDNGTFRPMTSCAVAVHYGGDCESRFTQLSAYQSSVLPRGGSVRTYLTAGNGVRYVIRDGLKREVLDTQSMQEASISGSFATVSGRTINAIPRGEPITRDSVYIRDRNSGEVSLYAAGELHAIGPRTASQIDASRLSVGELTPASIAMLPVSPIRFDGVVDTADGVVVLAGAQRFRWRSDAVTPQQAPVRVSDAFLTAYAESPVMIAPGVRLRGLSSRSTFELAETGVRQFQMDAVDAIAADTTVPLIRIPETILNGLPRLPAFLEPGALVRPGGSGPAYLIDGASTRIHTPFPIVATEVGFPAVRVTESGSTDAYTTAPSAMSFGVICGAKPFIGAGGLIRPLGPVYDDYAASIPFVELSAETCATLTQGRKMTRIIRVAGGEYFLIEHGVKRPLTASQLSRYGSEYRDVVVRFAAQFPTGPRV